ncbi:GDP-L-fucose synthase [Candidatus Roizmanbacteria bacterium]|nr:GDP-L-fucose synthase [Candidatus Roizmanbacteria bacterium]
MNNYFQNKKILLTGGVGFVGQHVLRELIKQGADKKNIVIPRHLEHDLRREKVCLDLTEHADIVINLAGNVGGIGYNRENPGLLFYDNMMMGVNLIEAARINKVKKFVQIGTICAYPKYTPIPFREEDLWNGYPEETNAPYGIAKKALLVMIQSYRTQYHFPGIYLLPVNMYGPGDNFDPKSSHVIAALIKKIYDAKHAGKKEISVWGNGSATREFFYVEDAARAIIAATVKYDKGEPVNIGAGFEISIKDLVTKLVDLMKFKGKIVWDKTKPNGQPRRCLDTSRAEKEFGFKATTSFDEGLKKTIEWYYKNN